MRKATDSMRLGSAAHRWLIGSGRLTVRPYPDWRKSAARRWRDETLARHEVPLLPKEIRKLEPMVRAGYQTLEEAGLCVPKARREQTIIWQDGDVICRSRLDLVFDQRIVDIKFVSRATPADFERSVYDHGYDIQSHAYRKALRQALPDSPPARFSWLVVETEPPHVSYLADVAGDAQILGEKRWDNAVRLWRTALQTKQWPGPQPGEIGVPKWAIDRFLEWEIDLYERKRDALPLMLGIAGASGTRETPI